jgi:hypothetical protein
MDTLVFFFFFFFFFITVTNLRVLSSMTSFGVQVRNTKFQIRVTKSDIINLTQTVDSFYELL